VKLQGQQHGFVEANGILARYRGHRRASTHYWRGAGADGGGR